ncbi:1-phosphofructokinase [Actinotalea sp. AC32]|nr:1-phosphofructokinase [Actinotalea sp. AC32]
MIVTVTLNPSLDRTVEVDALVRGAVLRARGTHLHPGGKGVNVTRALLANGVPSRAVLPVGGPTGAELVDLLRGDGVDHVVVPVRGRTRSNVAVAEPDGTVTKLNEPGPELDRAALDEVLATALRSSGPGDWVVLCGSLPPGAPDTHYADLVRDLAAAGRRVAVDTSGPALVHAVAAGPDLVKPNLDELSVAVCRTLESRADAVDAAHELTAAGAARVLVSLGADGGLLVDDDAVLVGRCVPVDARSTVGAGDAFLAGYLAATTAHDVGAGAALRTALAWGAAAVRLPGSQMPGSADVRLDDALLVTDAAALRMHDPLVGAG